ncbi:hypothetical protein N9I65_02190 [bacterium]|nr:hypothetical protein [bacterium]
MAFTGCQDSGIHATTWAERRRISIVVETASASKLHRLKENAAHAHQLALE